MGRDNLPKPTQTPAELDAELTEVLESHPDEAAVLSAYRGLFIPPDSDKFIEFTGRGKTGQKFTVTHSVPLPDHCLAAHLQLFGDEGETQAKREAVNTAAGRAYTCQLESYQEKDANGNKTGRKIARGYYYSPRAGEPFKIGVQLSSRDGKTRTVMLDLDAHRYYEMAGVTPPQTAEERQAAREAVQPYLEADAQTIINALEPYGFVSYREGSTSGGLHLWLFYEAAVTVGKVQTFFKRVLEPLETETVEVYPKADSKSTNRCYLPLELITPDGVVIPLNEAGFEDEIERSPTAAITSTAAKKHITNESTSQHPRSTPVKDENKADEVLATLEACALNPPASFERHEAVPAFLNLAERVDREAEMLTVLASNEVHAAWGLTQDGSRDLATWRGELKGWASQEPPLDEDGNPKRRGVPYLEGAGFDLAEVNQALKAAARQTENSGRETVVFPYVDKWNKIFHRKEERGGKGEDGERETINVDTPLCNFTARITEEVTLDDGAESKRVLRLTGRLENGRALPAVEVSASQFNSFSWLTEAWGAGAIINAGQSNKDRLREAIQRFSVEDGIQSTVSYAHLGWREIGGAWHYLHTGGAVTAAGLTGTVDVKPGDALQHYVLERPEATGQALRASLILLDAAPDGVSIPLLLSVYRSVLGTADFTVYLAGPTGSRKSALSAVVVAHFGREMVDGRHFPADWTATANALEGIAFAAKDALLVIDDFAPQGDRRQGDEYHRKASRLLRSQGNNSGRNRMRADGSLRPVKPPRGLILTTGEDVPKGHSIRARSFILELEPGDVKLDTLTRLQALGSEGVLAQALTAFLMWLAPRLSEVRAKLKQAPHHYRAYFESSHGRTTETCCELMFTFDLLEVFLAEHGVRVEGLRQRAFDALAEAADKQADHQTDQDDVSRFLSFLQGALASGKAHLVMPDGTRPPQAERYGWRQVEGANGASWQATGDKIGWLSEEGDLLLEPTATYAAVQKLARDSNDSLNTTKRTLWKRLTNAGVIYAPEKDRNTHKVTLEGSRRNVIRLKSQSLLSWKERDNRDSRQESREQRQKTCPENFYRPERKRDTSTGNEPASSSVPKPNGTANRSGTPESTSHTSKTASVSNVPVSEEVDPTGFSPEDALEFDDLVGATEAEL